MLHNLETDSNDVINNFLLQYKIFIGGNKSNFAPFYIFLFLISLKWGLLN